MIKLQIAKRRERPFKYFLFKFVCLLLIIIILDYLIGNILRHFYFKQESGVEYRTTYSLEKTTDSLLIFGSSRANHHYQPDIFEKRLNLSCYNVGEDGNTIFNDYADLRCILKRYSPKIIILDFKEQEFIKDQQSYDELSSLLPYYKTHPEIRSIIELRSPYERLKLLSSIYPYNSLLLPIAAGNAKFNKKKRGDIKGYVPLTQTWNGPIEIDTIANKYKIDSRKIKYYESFIQNCIDLKIKLYICCSPYFIKSSHDEYSIELGKQIAGKYKIKFFDYSGNSFFLNSDFFANITHLNDEGAKIFSNSFIDSIDKTTRICFNTSLKSNIR